MEPKTLAITLLAIAALAVGCKPASKPPVTDETRRATERQFDRVQQETTAAAQEINDYTYAQRDEFVTTMQAQLNEINRELDQLAAKIEKAGDQAKTEASPRLDALREQTAKLNQQLDNAKNATESTWDDIKAAVKTGYGEVKEGFNQARQWVSEKIAP
jgi:ABC-type transporter Mla subunit MlaD